MQVSLSSFLRTNAENHFEGPIPPAERDRIRIVESAERALERTLPPLERCLRSLTLAYGDVLRDSALVEASRQLLAEATPEATSAGRAEFGGDRHARLYRQRASMLADSAAWLADKAQSLAELARRDGKRDC